MRLLIFLIAIIFLPSCSAEYHLRQAEKRGAISQKDTILVESVKRDTVYLIDTIEISKDLDSLVDNLSGIPDTCEKTIKEIVLPAVVEYIVTGNNILKEPIIITDSLSTPELELIYGAEIWQDGTEVKLRLYINDIIVKETTYIAPEKKGKLKEWILYFIILGLTILIVFKR